MRVLFLISVKGHGRGGHFNSLNHISLALSQRISVGIVTVGPGRSKLLEDNPFFKLHIYSNGLNLFKVSKGIAKIANQFRADIIHCFDGDIYSIIRFAFVPNKYKIVLNKCGGPNTINFPISETLVLFSKENFTWFNNNDRFFKTKLYLIPNRVTPITVLSARERIIEKSKEYFTFLRIARIGEKYKSSILDSIYLVQKLNGKASKEVRLFLIGSIEDNEVFQQILKYVEKENINIEFLTEDTYTINASKMLYLADVVIATGRGLMEATSIPLPVLTPAKNSDTPILLDDSNFQTFFETNFSERNIADEKSLKFNLDNIIRMIDDSSFYESLLKISKSLFEIHFDLSSGVEKYILIYNNCLIENKKISWYINIKQALKVFYSFYKASIK